MLCLFPCDHWICWVWITSTCSDGTNYCPSWSVQYLLDHLLVDQQIVADARCLNPTEQNNKHGVERVGRPASSLLSVAEKGYVKKAFNWKEELLSMQLLMKLKVCESDKAKKKSRHSYWKQANLQLQMSTKNAEEEEYLCLDDYWVKIFEIKSSPSLSLQLITISRTTFN